MGTELIEKDNMPTIADDFLIAIADQAEKRIDAVIKIKQIALKVTNARDWTDQQGNPYLQVSGSEKIANLFNISWRIEEPQYEEEPNGHFTYSIKGTFSLGGRTIEVEGTRSSKDGFFNRYEWITTAGKQDEKKLLPPSSIDKGDVKKAALTNLYGNGITRMLGIRNLTWEDLGKYAGITQAMVKDKVSYNQRESSDGKSPITPPQAKKEVADSTQKPTDTFQSVVEKVEKSPKSEAIFITAGSEKFSTFDKRLAEAAKALIGQLAELAYTTSGKYKNLTNISAAEAYSDPDGCTKNPATCEVSAWDGLIPYCGDEHCKYRVENA